MPSSHSIAAKSRWLVGSSRINRSGVRAAGGPAGRASSGRRSTWRSGSLPLRFAKAQALQHLADAHFIFVAAGQLKSLMCGRRIRPTGRAKRSPPPCALAIRSAELPGPVCRQRPSAFRHRGVFAFGKSLHRLLAQIANRVPCVKLTLPLEDVSSPARIRNRVVLPMPLGPTSPTLPSFGIVAVSPKRHRSRHRIGLNLKSIRST